MTQNAVMHKIQQKSQFDGKAAEKIEFLKAKNDRISMKINK